MQSICHLCITCPCQGRFSEVILLLHLPVYNGSISGSVLPKLQTTSGYIPTVTANQPMCVIFKWYSTHQHVHLFTNKTDNTNRCFFITISYFFTCNFLCCNISIIQHCVQNANCCDNPHEYFTKHASSSNTCINHIQRQMEKEKKQKQNKTKNKTSIKWEYK